MMKRFLIKISIFIILFAAANWIYLKLIQNFDWNFNKVIEIASFENKEFDYMIIGNSLALDGFDMVYLHDNGVNAYNTAIAGATIKTNVIQLEEYLKKNKAPKVIIQGLSSYRNTDFNSEIVHPAVEYTYVKKLRSYKDIPMIKFKWMADELLKKLVSKDHREAKILYGQLRTNKTVEDKTEYSKIMNLDIDLARYESSKYLAKIDSICLERKIKLINLEMPAQKEAQNNIAIGPINYNNKDGQACKFYNYNNVEFCKIFDSKTDWLGDSHLNLSGSQKFTKQLFNEGLFD